MEKYGIKPKSSAQKSASKSKDFSASKDLISQQLSPSSVSLKGSFVKESDSASNGGAAYARSSNVVYTNPFAEPQKDADVSSITTPQK